MKYFTLPADFQLSTLDKYSELNKKYKDSKVIETYGQITSTEIVNSGRVSKVLPKVDMPSLTEYISYSKSKGIDFNYTLNPSCLGNLEFSDKGMNSIYSFLKELEEAGVDSITATSPALMELITKGGFAFKLKASAICEIINPFKASFYKGLNTERIVVDPDVTRDFAMLGKITEAYGEGVEILINNVCLKHCAYKMFHYNHESHSVSMENNDQLIDDYFLNRCELQKTNKKENVIKLSWIRPEDLNFYQKVGINHFKIQGRQNVLFGDPAKTVEYYMQEYFDGDLSELLNLFAPYTNYQPYMENRLLDGFVEKFYQNTNFCRQNCSKCNYCLKIAEKVLPEYNLQEHYNKILSGDKYAESVNILRKENIDKKLVTENLQDVEFNLDI